MKTLSRGYLSLRDKDVRLDPWSVSLDGHAPLANPEHLDDWSYYQSIRIQITTVADREALHDRLQIGSDAALGLAIIWVSPGTSLRGASAVFPLDELETSAELLLDGGLLRGDLKLECQIVLLRSSAISSPLAPATPGSIVWSSTHSIRLEGLGSRMPILAVPFSRHMSAAGNHALWWLQVSAIDLHAPADSALWMWLNDENWMIRELLSDPSSEGAQRTQQFLRTDFYRQLVEIGIRDDEFDITEDYPTGSLGAVITVPVRLLGGDLGDLRSQFRNEPQRLEAEMQARLGGL